MDALLLQAVLPELRQLTGHPVTKVELIGKFALALHFGGEKRPLYVSAHPDLSRVTLVAELPGGEEPRPASDNLEEPLKRGRLERVEQERGERVAVLHFSNPEARHAEVKLVLELIPRFANVILVGNDDRILWTRREFDGERSRRVTPGQRYEFPEPAPGVRLPELTRETIERRIEEGSGGPLFRQLPRAWGGGAGGAVEIFEKAGLDVIERVLGMVERAAEPAPVLGRASADDPWVLFPVDPGELPGWEFSGANEPAGATIDRWYREREGEAAQGGLETDLRRVLVRKKTRAAKALQQIERRLAEANRAEELRAQAELLAAHQSQLRRGMSEVRLPAFDGGDDTVIPLDPKLDPPGNVEAKFKKAKRAARGRDELIMQKSIQATELEDADRGIGELEAAGGIDELRAVAKEHAPSLLDAKPGKAKKAARPDKPRHPSLPEGFNPRVYELPGGWIVWVGRNARQNDELSHRRSSPKDLWFHARGSQGSHTVLRVGSGKGEPAKETIELAASIAAFHSKARNSKLVPVAYCERRYVRKPRKAPVGTALIMREKVVMVEPKEPSPPVG